MDNSLKSGSSTGSHKSLNLLVQQSQSTESFVRKRNRFVLIVSVLMVVTGTIITLATKWTDNVKAKGTNPKSEHYFIHPYVQTLGMFAGEAGCLGVFQILYYYHKWMKKDMTKFGKQKFSPFVFAIPAICDIFATSFLFVGLNLTLASSYQILRGAVIIFTALLSKAFFGSKLQVFHWVGMLAVVAGLVVVGLGDVIGHNNSSGNTNSVLTGDLLIVGSQIISAVQINLEQLFVQGLNVPPLQAVGWEGVFGFCFLGVAFVPMYFIPWHLPAGLYFWYDHCRFEDAIDAVYQIFYIPKLTVVFFGVIVCLAIYNYAEVSVTKEINAITTMTLDSIRVLFIWIFGMIVQWEMFSIYQPIGFLILVIGVCVYYDVIFSRVMKKLHIWPSFCGVSDGEY